MTSVDISFVAGFGPILRDQVQSLGFWRDAVGLELEEVAPDYYHAAPMDGVRVFGLWPLSQAAEATFGASTWPAERPVPQAWLELDVATHDAVGPAIAELRAQGCEVLTEAHLEPWGQTTARVQSPEGLLVGVSHTPWLHAGDSQAREAHEPHGTAGESTEPG